MSEGKSFRLELLNDLESVSTVARLTECKNLLIEFIQHLKNSYNAEVNDLSRNHLFSMSVDGFLQEIRKLKSEKRLLIFIIFNKLEKKFFIPKLTELLTDTAIESKLILRDELKNSLSQNAILEEYLSEESIILMSYVLEDRMQEYRLLRSWKCEPVERKRSLDTMIINIFIVIGGFSTLAYWFGRDVCQTVFSLL